MHQTSTANTQNNDWTVWCAPRFVWKNKFKLMQKTNYSKLLARCWRSNGHANLVAHCSSENYDEWQVRSVRVLAVQLAPKRKSTKYQLLSLFSHTCAIFMCAKENNTDTHSPLPIPHSYVRSSIDALLECRPTWQVIFVFRFVRKICKQMSHSHTHNALFSTIGSSRWAKRLCVGRIRKSENGKRCVSRTITAAPSIRAVLISSLISWKNKNNTVRLVRPDHPFTPHSYLFIFRTIAKLV